MDYMQFVRILIFVQCFAYHNAKAAFKFDQLSSDEEDAIVDAHNRYRKAVDPEASNMKKLEWDNELASKAQATIDRCSYTAPDCSTGENLFFKEFNGINTMRFVIEAVEAWYNENQHYYYSHDKCYNPVPGEASVCSNYKQMVWADTSEIGCGVKSCDFINYTTIDILLCYYQPGAAKNNGEMAHGKPYEKGSPCTLCDDGHSCENNLCCKITRRCI